MLDLRENRSQSLTEALALAGLFLSDAPIVPSRDADATVTEHCAEPSTPVWTRPLVVLTSRRTEGAAEILVGALSDYRRALHIGDSSTSGVGNVASLVSLTSENNERFGYVVLPWQSLFRPSGLGLHNCGVAPDVVLPSQRSTQRSDRPVGMDRISSSSRFRSILSEATSPLASDTLRAELASGSASRRQLPEFTIARRVIYPAAGFVEPFAVPTDELRRDDDLRAALAIACDYSDRIHNRP